MITIPTLAWAAIVLILIASYDSSSEWHGLWIMILGFLAGFIIREEQEKIKKRRDDLK